MCIRAKNAAQNLTKSLGKEMNTNLSSTTPTAGNSLQSVAFSGPASPKSTLGKVMSGEDFANLMRSLLPAGERQEIAASGAMGSASGLKTSQLGAQFDLVTTEAPLPDNNSLAAFAKSQGLTDGAVQALFGELQPLQLKSLAVPPSALSTGSKTVDGTIQDSILLDAKKSELTTQSTQPAWFNTAASLLSPATEEPQALARLGNHDTDGPLATGSTTQSVLGALMGVGNSMPHTPTVSRPVDMGNANSEPSPEIEPTQLALSRLLSQNGAQLTVGQVGGLNSSGTAAQVTSVADAAQTDPINLNALRMSLIPAWENMTRQLASANGTQAQKWANLINGWGNGSQKTGTSESIIDLGSASIGDAIDTGDGMGKVSATFNSDNNIQLPNGTSQAPMLNLNDQLSAKDAPVAPSTDSATQISQMADQLGQALSERLQTQIEQGQWKMELKLKPAHLGKISVDLDMNSGGLDAVFKTDNPMTRDLLVQSTQRLRDNLEQAGMTVANVWVNHNNQQGSGGNSTPWQQAQSNRSVELKTAETQTAQNMSNIAKSADGWDQLV
jgi:flagellar hook-length control protein FliK